MRKITRKGVVRKLDKLVGDIVKQRDGLCVTCGSMNNLQPGHLFSRVAYSTRWDLNNTYCQCRNCNLKHEYDPYPLTNYFIEIWGRKKLDALHRQYVTPRKFKTYELEELYNELSKLVVEKVLREDKGH